MIRLLLFSFFMLFCFFVSAQQEPIFSHYYNNEIIFNPATAGSKKYNKFTINTRQQWAGFEGAPLSTNISFHGAVNNRSALGGYIMYDKADPALRADLSLSYAYHVPLDYDNFNLSFGISSKLIYYNLDYTELEIPVLNDNAISNKTYTKTSPEASAGVLLYSRNLRLGYSSINILQNSFKDPENQNYENILYRNHFIIGAYKFAVINNDWQFEPSFLYRKQELNTAVTTLSLRAFYLKDTWGGVSFKNDGNIGFNLGFGSGNIHFAYSYDYTFRGDIASYNFGSHELMIEVRLSSANSERHISFWEY